jgi:hypothetical protein
VYVTTDIPKAMALTKPVFEIVATEVLAETQGVVVEGDPDPVSCIEEPTQIGTFPEIVGFAFTVTVKLVKQPKLLV